MKISSVHSWDVSPREAIRIQRQIREKIISYGKVRSVRHVAGADVAYDKKSNTTFAGVIVLRMTDLAMVETSVASCSTSFPYIPGLLTFREAPALVQALEKIQSNPEVLFIDGHGLSHPRSVGIASHIGLLIDRPVIGCAKSLLIGDYHEPDLPRGSRSYLFNKHSDIIGAVVRTRDRVKPVFISIGHRIDLDEAIRLTLCCGKGYRIPETTRQADLLVEKFKRES
ncbi:MAG: deoxyribonuclease V [Nitrospirales bacterium]|nr:deoxyribonuclease V [Nitrospirales bacterium]